jgi:voltage-gated potassium channel
VAVAREPVVMALGAGRWRWAYELSMVVLALAVVALLPLEDAGWVRVTNLTVWGVFVVDYFTRLALSTDRRGFVRANVVDLLAIMPADFFRALRVLRLARLFRVLRAGSIMWRVTRDVRGVAGTNGLGWVLLVSLTTVFAGGIGAWLVEPTIATLPDGLWWSTVTATTVGYGDLSPEHPVARGMAVVLMLVGIGTIGMLTGSIATYFLGGEAGAADPDVEHVRARLADWEELTAEERQRVAAMLHLLANRSGLS